MKKEYEIYGYAKCKCNAKGCERYTILGSGVEGMFGLAEARLIYAAPDLLEASKDAHEVIALYIKRLKESGYDTKGGMLESTLRQLKMTIRKAEGKPCGK